MYGNGDIGSIQQDKSKTKHYSNNTQEKPI